MVEHEIQVSQFCPYHHRFRCWIFDNRIRTGLGRRFKNHLQTICFARSCAASIDPIWLSGYYAAKRGLPTIQVQALEKNMKELELFCKKVDNLEVPLVQAVEKVLGPSQ